MMVVSIFLIDAWKGIIAYISLTVDRIDVLYHKQPSRALLSVSVLYWGRKWRGLRWRNCLVQSEQLTPMWSLASESHLLTVLSYAYVSNGK